MIKTDIIDRVAEKTGISKVVADWAVSAFFESMKQNLVKGNRIELRGFGVFSLRSRKQGIGRNPRTGEVTAIAPGWTVRFRPSKELTPKANTTKISLPSKVSKKKSATTSIKSQTIK